MVGCLEGVSRNEVVVLQEETARGRRKEDDGREHQEEDRHAQNVVNGVVRVEGNTIHRLTRGVFVGFDFNAIGVVRAHFVQRNNVRHHQAQQHQWYCNYVQGKEAVERGVAHHKVTTNQQCQIGADKGDGREQVHNHLGAPVRHLAPWQQIAHKGFSHQHQEDGATKHPHQLARLAVRAINQAPEHMQIHHHKEHGSTSGVHVTD